MAFTKLQAVCFKTLKPKFVLHNVPDISGQDGFLLHLDLSGQAGFLLVTFELKPALHGYKLHAIVRKLKELKPRLFLSFLFYNCSPSAVRVRVRRPHPHFTESPVTGVTKTNTYEN